MDGTMMRRGRPISERGRQMLRERMAKHGGAKPPEKAPAHGLRGTKPEPGMPPEQAKAYGRRGTAPALPEQASARAREAVVREPRSPAQSAAASRSTMTPARPPTPPDSASPRGRWWR